MTKFFEVGGCVRDEIMGVRSKDIDFSVEADSFEAMVQAVEAAGVKIVVSHPEFVTLRGVAKKPFMGHTGGLDFVLARKDGTSTDGRRPDFVEPGTLLDDLARRDFTMNAIAKDEDGNFIDPFGGMLDIRHKVIICVGSTRDRLFEDALRGLRALRFAITKGFHIDKEIQEVLHSAEFAEALSSVSKERQREEMEKMFSHDTVLSMLLMNRFQGVMNVVFSDGLRLTPTMRER